jgi:tRNA1Val (adenine37-N6)-methyltransferase
VPVPGQAGINCFAMPNPFFRFKQFTVYHDRSAMKVTTDSCFFGAWAARELQRSGLQIDNVLDIGTGTGLLSLMIAQKNEVNIDAVELDEDAAQQARENVSVSPWKSRIKIFNQDVVSFHPAKQYECIVCNPPFYENELASAYEKKNLAHHSSQLRVEQVLQFIKLNLKEDGLFFLLYPFKRQDEIAQTISSTGFHIGQQVMLRQTTKHPPFRTMVMGTTRPTDKISTAEISIWNDKQEYTDAFTDLLKDYYLYL